LAITNREEKLRKEIESFRADSSTLTTGELDRELAEFSNEIQFLEEQVGADFDSYQPAQLERAKEKIARFKKKAEILEMEISRRNSKLTC